MEKTLHVAGKGRSRATLRSGTGMGHSDPPLVGLTYWFLTAPDPRFANALFFLLTTSSCLLLLLSVQPRVNTRAFAAVLCVVFLVGNAHLLQYSISHKWLPRHCAMRSWIAWLGSAGWQ